MTKNFVVYKSSAGSGKTFTLVKAYLKLALSDDAPRPIAYKKILAITFTNKAAAEMKLRIIEALKQFHEYYTDDFKVEYPTRSGNFFSLKEIADSLSKRLNTLFIKDENGRRAVLGDNNKLQTDPYFKDNILFHEYFNGDNGKGLGASHQTGWTGLITVLE